MSSQQLLTHSDDLGPQAAPGNPLRVATVVSNLYFCGGSTRILAFARRCSPGRVQHCVITLAQPNGRDEFGSMREDFQEAGVDVLDLREPPWKLPGKLGRWWMLLVGPWKITRLTWRLRRVIDEREIQVIDVHGFTSLLVGVLATLFRRKVAVVTTAYYLGLWDRFGLRSLGRYVFGRTALIMTDSQKRCDEIQRWTGLPAGKCRVIRNGIDAPVPETPPDAVRRHFGLDRLAGRLIIGQVSQIQHFKGQEVLLAAAEILLERGYEVAFLLCGHPRPHGGEQFVEQLRRRVQLKGLEEWIRIGSYSGNIGDVWQLIDIHAHPTLWDSSPIAITEAMSLAKPSVVSDEGGIPELVIDGQTGFVVPKGDVAATADALIKLVESPDLAAEMGGAARRLYERVHRPEMMHSRLEAVFAEAARKSHAGDGAVQ